LLSLKQLVSINSRKIIDPKKEKFHFSKEQEFSLRCFDRRGGGAVSHKVGIFKLNFISSFLSF
jgi:hypothetical protein